MAELRLTEKKKTKKGKKSETSCWMALNGSCLIHGCSPDVVWVHLYAGLLYCYLSIWLLVMLLQHNFQITPR